MNKRFRRLFDAVLPLSRGPRPSRSASRRRNQSGASRVVAAYESLESRQLLSAAQDVTQLTALRNDPIYAAIDGQLASGQRVAVAVLDSGVEAQHPDLSGNFLAFFDAVTTDASDAAITPGTTDITQTFDPDGHGTHVTGTVASTNPDIGVAVKAGFVGVRALPSSGDPNPNFDTLISSLTWVKENAATYNIKVVNMSLGFPSVHTNTVPPLDQYGSLIQELEQLGITVVSSSGNAYGYYRSLGVSNPAVFSTLNVASSWEDAGIGDSLPDLRGSGFPLDTTTVVIDAAPTADQLAAYSQRSSLPNQVLAPGATIYSTYLGNSYTNLTGTSMSSPFVAGMVALMQDAAFTYGGRYLLPDEVRAIMQSTADIVNDAEVASTQFGRFVGYNPDGSINIQNIQNLAESGIDFFRVNVYSAIKEIRSMFVVDTPTDANNTIDEAIVAPSIDPQNPFITTGNLGTDGTALIGPNDIDLYKITLSNATSVVVRTDPVAGGQTVKSFLRVFDAAGNQIASGDNTGGANYPLVQTGVLTAGTYYVGVSAFANVQYDIVNGGGIAAGQSTGDYQLGVYAVSPDPNGIPAGADNVPLTSPDAVNPVPTLLATQGVARANRVTAKLGSDPNPLYNPARPAGQTPTVLVGPADVDMYKIVAPDDGTVYLSLDTYSITAAATNDGYVRVFEQFADGSLHQVAAGQGDRRIGDTLAVDVRLGHTYFVGISTTGNTNYNPNFPYGRTAPATLTDIYDLFASFSNGDLNGTIYTATDVRALDPNRTGLIWNQAIGSDVLPGGGVASSIGALGGYKDVDFYAYTAPTTGVFQVTVNVPSTAFNPSVTLWTRGTDGGLRELISRAGESATDQAILTAGQQIWFSITGQGNTNDNWFTPAGGNGGGTGVYNASYGMLPAGSLKALSNDSIQNATPTPIKLNAALLADLGSDGNLAIGAGDIDMYRFTATKTMSVEIRTIAQGEGSADTFLRLFDANGRPLGFNDNANGSTISSRVTLTVLAGQTYFIGVNGSSPNALAYNPLTGRLAVAGKKLGTYQVQVREISQPIVATGADPGNLSHVRVFEASTGNVKSSFLAYGSTFKGGVKVATGDVTGDGIADIVTGVASGAAAHIKVFDGATGQVLAGARGSFFAYDTSFTNGIDLAVGDVNGDGYADIITGTNAGPVAHVKVFSGRTGLELSSFRPFGNGFTGGVKVATGDVNGDGASDIVVAAGSEAGPHVRVFNGRTGAVLPSPVGNFFAFDPGFRGGIDVAVGDVNGDGLADIVTSIAGGNVAPGVKVFSGKDRTILKSFLAYESSYTGGVRVAAADVNGDGKAEILTAPGRNRVGVARMFDGRTNAVIHTYTAYGDSYRSGFDVSVSGPLPLTLPTTPGTPSGSTGSGSTASGSTGSAPVAASAVSAPVTPSTVWGQVATSAATAPVAASSDLSPAQLTLSLGSPIIATGTNGGVSAHIRVIEAASGRERLSFLPFTTATSDFTGPITVATGDVTGDGIPDVVAALGAGGTPTFTAFDGLTGAFYGSILAYPAAVPGGPLFSNGIQVAMGDINNDGIADIITGTNATVGPHVKAFDGVTGAEIRSFYAFDPNFLAGIKVASGDVNNDGYADIVVSAASSQFPHVKVFDGLTGGQLPGRIGSFYAMPLGQSGAIDIAVADVDGDNWDDIIAGTGAGFDSQVRVYSGRSGALIRNITPFPAGFRGGINVSAADLDRDGAADISVAVASAAGPSVRTFSGRTGAQLTSRVGSFFAYSSLYKGGIDIASYGVPNPRPPVVDPIGFSASSLDAAFGDTGLADSMLTAGV